MSLWFSDYALEDIAGRFRTNMLNHLGIEYLELGEDCLTGRMPVDHRTTQPFGLLHGGASCVLAESLGSVAANLVVNPETHYCLGLDINANHLRSVASGWVIGKARPIHIGRRTHVWEIRIEDESEKLVCISRLTMAVMEKE